MLDFGLKHPSDYVALHESVAGEVHRLELKREEPRSDVPTRTLRAEQCWEVPLE